MHNIHRKKHEAEFLDEIQTKVLRIFLLEVTTSALHWKIYFFKLTQPFTVSAVQLLYTVKKKEANLTENHTPFGMVLRNPYRNLKSENSKDYA